MKTLFDQLKQEHTEVKQLFKKAENCDPGERMELLDQIEKELVPHARAEEKTLYALMREIAEQEEEENLLDLTNEAYEEHRVVDELIKDLKACDAEDEKWPAKLKVIRENIEHHISEEENQLFDHARRLFNEGQLVRLLDAYRSSKQESMETLPTQAQIQERKPSQQSRQILH